MFQVNEELEAAARREADATRAHASALASKQEELTNINEELEVNILMTLSHLLKDL
jgi:hypothetical protein